MELALDLPIYAYSSARSLAYGLEFLLLDSISYLMPGRRELQKSAPKRDWEQFKAVRRDLQALLRRDSICIRDGVYPARVLFPESPALHLRRMPTLILDAYSIVSRRVKGRTTEFDREASALLDELPRYYRRNFHFQTGGYLSRRSAQVYEHQVELLFAGAADAMRRLILEPLRNHFADHPEGEGLRFLEIGAGTGRATRFVRLAFPKAKIVAVDLSDPYLKEAQRKLASFSRIDFVQADGAALPFQPERFDAVYSVFLFHELPHAVRRDVLQEARRMVKPGGFVGFVDSVQTGDKSLFDPLLDEFPKQFHEPYYRDYIAHPMEAMMKDQAGLARVKTSTGFSAKVCWGVRKKRKPKPGRSILG